MVLRGGVAGGDIGALGRPGAGSAGGGRAGKGDQMEGPGMSREVMGMEAEVKGNQEVTWGRWRPFQTTLSARGVRCAGQGALF